MALLRTLLQPRSLLLLFGAGIVIGLAWVLVSASQPVAKPWEQAAMPLLTGEMADFEPTEFPRGAPEILVQRGDEQAYLPDLVGGGQVTLVNLWASWCAPCLEELPSLAALGEATGARVLPIAQEGHSPANAAALAKAGVTDRLSPLHDPQLQLSRSYGGGDARLPVTVIYGPRGQEAGRLIGAADWSSPEAVRLVKAIGEGAAL